MYKLGTAIWYIDLLEDLGAGHGFLLLVGIEMALDGAVTALSSAFDAAVGGLHQCGRGEASSSSERLGDASTHAD